MADPHQSDGLTSLQGPLATAAVYKLGRVTARQRRRHLSPLTLTHHSPGHVNLLADLLERLLEERERVQRDGLLLLGGLLAASTHHEGVMEARELRRGSSARELRGGVRLTDVSAHSAQSELHS